MPAMALVGTFSIGDDINVIEHFEYFRRRSVNGANDGVSGMGDTLEQLHALQRREIVEAALYRTIR